VKFKVPLYHTEATDGTRWVWVNDDTPS